MFWIDFCYVTNDFLTIGFPINIKMVSAEFYKPELTKKEKDYFLLRIKRALTMDSPTEKIAKYEVENLIEAIKSDNDIPQSVLLLNKRLIENNYIDNLSSELVFYLTKKEPHFNKIKNLTFCLIAELLTYRLEIFELFRIVAQKLWNQRLANIKIANIVEEMTKILSTKEEIFYVSYEDHSINMAA